MNDSVIFFPRTNIGLEFTRRARLSVQFKCPSQVTTHEQAKTETLLHVSSMWLLYLEKMHFLIHMKKPGNKGEFIIVLKAHKKKIKIRRKKK